MARKKHRDCHACGKTIAAGDATAHIRMGTRRPNSWRLTDSKIWAVMHRGCFLESLRSPKAARLLLEESHGTH